jgi:hypothetical protein
MDRKSKAKERLTRLRADPEFEAKRMAGVRRAAKRPEVAIPRNARLRAVQHAAVMKAIQANRTFEERSVAALKGHETRRARRKASWESMLYEREDSNAQRLLVRSRAPGDVVHQY